MSANGDRQEQLKERIRENEPLVNPAVLEQWANANLPLRGPLRDEMIVRVVQTMKERRTIGGISARLANQAASPITNAIQEQLEGRLQRRIQEMAQTAAGDEGSMADMRPVEAGPGILRDVGKEQ